MREIEEDNRNNSEDDQSPSSLDKPSKEVKRKKARAKELEGIDLRNIVSSSRKRSTSSYTSSPPTKTKVLVETSSNRVEGSHNNNENNDNEEDNSDDDGSQSEEFNDGTIDVEWWSFYIGSFGGPS
ncbi:hypothetical protein JHK86_047726 [Glycine max]|nr:hypothetical protein JHK86_047726 [Glycine max]